MEKQTRAIVRGIIIASGWNADGEVTEVEIAGYDERKYRVANEKTGKTLQSLLKRRIIAEGLVTTEKNRPTIHIHHFRIDNSDPKLPLKPQGRMK